MKRQSIQKFVVVSSMLVVAFAVILSGNASTPPAPAGKFDEFNSLGIVTGAVLDKDSGRVVLTGSGEHPELSPSESVVATAFQWIYPETPRMPYVSIDPFPDDPEGPFMLIDFDPVSRGTKFGWIMFEADRLLKCLALGKDNIFGLPESSSVDGYRNIFEWSEIVEKDKKEGEDVWSRFWFYPQESKVQWDKSGVRILDCRVGVKTEVMILKGGKLISTQGKQDPGAKAFADHFTENYRSYGEEFPVFLELEQLARLLLISEWLREIREESRPVSLAWVRSLGGSRFAMPAITPSLRSTKETSVTVGNVIETSRRQLFGGVDLAVIADRVAPNRSFSDWRENLSELINTLEGNETTFTLGTEKGKLLPQIDARQLERPDDVLMTMRINEDSFRVEGRPGRLSRSLFGDGSGRELAMPYLPSYRPEGILGKSSKIGVEGRPDSWIETRNYELLAPDGSLLGLFEQHRVDPVSGEIVIENKGDPQSSWLLSPDPGNPAVMWAVNGNERRWAFDIGSGEVVAEFRGKELYQYGYNRFGKIESVGRKTGESEEMIPVLRVGRDYEKGPITSLRSGDDQRLTFRSEARLPESERVVEFEAKNEGRESKQVKFNPETDSFELADGSRASDSGFSAIEVNRDKVHLHYSQGGKDLRILGTDGYTLFLAGKESIVIPIHENEVDRQFAKAVDLPSELVAESRLSQFFPEAASGVSLFVADSSPSLRHNAALVGRKIRPDHLIFSTNDVRRAESNVKKLTGQKLSEKGGFTVAVLSETLEGQDQALRELASTEEKTTGPKGDATPVTVVVGHTKEGTMEKVLDSCRRGSGSLVVGLFCNTSVTAKESQQMADRMVEAGAGAAIVPRGLLDAKDAARIMEEMNQFPTTGNPFQWFNGILKRLGLEEKFGPPTADAKTENKSWWKSFNRLPLHG